MNRTSTASLFTIILSCGYYFGYSAFASEEVDNKFHFAAEIFNQGDVPRATSILTSLAQDLSHPPSANALGVMYLEGQQVAKDIEKARKWLLLASSYGSRVADYNLGLMDSYGLSTPLLKEDYVSAFRWFSKAAKLNLEQAYLALAQLYFQGKGVKQDYQKALTWYTKAADSGNEEAMAQTALLYSKNYSSSLPRSISWLMLILGIQQQENRQKAFYWMQRAAVRGYAPAQYNLAMMYEKGIGTKKNKTLAKRYFIASAEQRYMPAAEKIKSIR